MKKIIEHFKGKIDFEIKKEIKTIEEVLTIYKSLKFLIGSRLHSTILSYLVTTPFLCIEYQGFKARGTYSLTGSQHRVFTLTKINKELKKVKMNLIKY